MAEKKGSINAYTCKNLHSIITLHVDAGTTPMFISCPKCNERSTSRMGDINNTLKPTHEWFLQTREQAEKEADDYVNDPENAESFKHVNKDDVKKSFLNHWEQGGLSLRKAVSEEVQADDENMQTVTKGINSVINNGRGLHAEMLASAFNYLRDHHTESIDNALNFGFDEHSS